MNTGNDEEYVNSKYIFIVFPSCRYEVERINRELQEMKKKYYTIKKKEEQRLENEAKQLRDTPLVSRTAPSMLLESQQEAAKRARIKFTGGGYAVK